MRIQLLVRVLMMTAMYSGPPNHWTLCRHAAAEREERCDWSACCERLMREETVIANRYAQRGNDIKRAEQHNIHEVEPTTPREHHHRNERERWRDDRNHGEHANGEHWTQQLHIRGCMVGGVFVALCRFRFVTLDCNIEFMEDGRDGTECRLSFGRVEQAVSRSARFVGRAARRV